LSYALLHNKLHAYKFTRRFRNIDARPYFVLIRHACAPSFRAVGASYFSLSLSDSLSLSRIEVASNTHREFDDRPVNCMCALITIYRCDRWPLSIDIYVYIHEWRVHGRLALKLAARFGIVRIPASQLINPFIGTRISRRIFCLIETMTTDRISIVLSKNFPKIPRREISW